MECATDQEIEDTAIAAAQLEAETEYYQTQTDALTAEIDAYCSQYPWDCIDSPEAGFAPVSGPAHCGKSRCWDFMIAELVALASSVGNLAGYRGAVADAVRSGLRLSRPTVVYWYTFIGLSAFAVGYGLGAYVDCWQRQTPGPTLLFDDPRELALVQLR
jgi:hypothetical protein